MVKVPECANITKSGCLGRVTNRSHLPTHPSHRSHFRHCPQSHLAIVSGSGFLLFDLLGESMVYHFDDYVDVEQG